MATLLRRLGASIALGVLLVAVVAIPPPAYACSCAEGATDGGSYQRAAVVFAGDLLSDNRNLFGGTRTLTYRVHRVYKGSALERQAAVTAVSSASCGLELGGEDSGPWLVFAQQRANELAVGLCQGTRVGSAPAPFGAGVAPRAGSDGRSSAWWLAGAAGLAAAGLMLARRRRRGVLRRAGTPTGDRRGPPR